MRARTRSRVFVALAAASLAVAAGEGRGPGPALRFPGPQPVSGPDPFTHALLNKGPLTGNDDEHISVDPDLTGLKK